MLQTPPRKQRHKATTLLAFDDVMERRLDNRWYICTVLRVNHKQQTVDIHYKDTGNPEYDVPYDQDLRPVVSHRTPPLGWSGSTTPAESSRTGKMCKTHQQQPTLGNPTGPSWLLDSQKALAQSARRQEAYQTTHQFSQEIMDRATKVEIHAKAQV